MSQELFQEELPQEQSQSVLETLVGDGKKYKDQEALAKAKLSADQTIKDREEENARLREALERKLDTEDLLRRAAAEEPPVKTPEVQQPELAREPAITKDQLRETIRQTISEETEQKTSVSNMELVAQELVKQLGDTEKSKAFIAQKAQELGVPLSWLQESAARSPKAFFQTVGLTVSATSTPKPSTSDVNPRSLSERPSNLAPGTKAYYDEIRRTDFNRWMARDMQGQIIKAHRAALEKGDKW